MRMFVNLETKYDLINLLGIPLKIINIPTYYLYLQNLLIVNDYKNLS